MDGSGEERTVPCSGRTLVAGAMLCYRAVISTGPVCLRLCLCVSQKSVHC